MVVTISINAIPSYLRDSAFAKAFEDEDGTIDVPRSCYKSNLMIESCSDLTLLLSTLRFWGVDTIPREIILYVIWKKPQEILHSTGDYEKELRYLPFLQALCAKTAQSCGERASDYYAHSDKTFWGGKSQRGGKNEKQTWSADPAEAAAQICLIHYDNADGDIWTANTTALAARLGQIHALTFLHENGCPWDECTCSSAAGGGHLSCLQYAHEHGCSWDVDTCTEAAQHHHLPCLKYACENGCPTDVQTSISAVRHGPCYEFLRERGLLILDAELCATAARSNNLPLLTSLRSVGCPWNKRTCEDAAQAHSIACLRYAHRHGCAWDSVTCDTAAQFGSLACLKYAVNHGCPLSPNVLLHSVIAPLGLKYLHEMGLPWHKDVCEKAAFFDNIDSLQYAHVNGCPWDARTCETAAGRGQLAALQYAHQHGCPWDARTVNAAAVEGRDGCLEYALAHGCPTDHTTCNRAAAKSLGCLILARKHGCTLDASTCTAAARAGKVECLQYLFEQDCPWDAATTYAAVEAGALGCLQYAYERGCALVVAEVLTLPLSVKTRLCLEYVRDQAPAEAAVYDASVLAQQKRLEHANAARLRHHGTAQYTPRLKKILYAASRARDGYAVSDFETLAAGSRLVFGEAIAARQTGTARSYACEKHCPNTGPLIPAQTASL
jgi:hypothetical protein